MRDIAGFEGRYSITDDGRVWSHAKRHAANGSQGHNGKWLKPRKHSKGYLVVSLFALDGIRSQRFVHRLVAEAYLSNPNKLPQVNHKDGDKTRNFDTNLEWSTAGENIRHALATGLVNTRHPNKIAAARRNAIKARAAARGVQP